MTGKLRSNFSRARLTSFGLEILVVIFGILIAFQIDSWAESVRERSQEREYLLRLRQDLAAEIAIMEAGKLRARNRIAAAQLLQRLAADPGLAAEQTFDVVESLEKVAWRSFPPINAYVYTELQSTGKLALIRSDSLRRALAEYYTALELDERVGVDIRLQEDFDRLTAGILTMDELVSMERSSGDEPPAPISAARSAQVAEEFAARPEAVALLPGVAQHNAFNERVLAQGMDRARELIAIIDDLLGHAGE